MRKTSQQTSIPLRILRRWKTRGRLPVSEKRYLRRRNLDERRLFRRRYNPDDLEELEKMVKARDIYRETGSITRACEAVGYTYRKVIKWIDDLIPEDPRKQALKIFLETGSIRETARRVNANERTVKKWIKGLQFVDPRLEKAKEAYLTTGSITKTAEHIGVSRQTMRVWLRSLGLLPSKKKLSRQRKLKKLRYQTLYNKGYTDKQIAKKLGCSITSVGHWRNIQLPTLPPNKAVNLDVLEIRNLAEAGKSIKSIAEQFGVARSVINRLLAKKRRRHNPRMSDETWKAIMVDILDGGLNLSQASEKHGVPVSTISARLKKRPYAQGQYFSRPWAHGRDKHGRERRNPGDEEMRQHQRRGFSGDIEAEKQLLIRRIRAGEVDPRHVELAAYLDHPPSQLLIPKPSLIFSSDLGTRIERVLGLGNLEQGLLMTIAVDFADHVLPIWINYAPEDERPILALEEARVRIRSLGLDGNVDQASLDAYNAAHTAPENSAAYNAARAADVAADACSEFNPAKRLDYIADQHSLAVWGAARVSNYAAEAAENSEVEREWQRQYLIEALLAGQ